MNIQHIADEADKFSWKRVYGTPRPAHHEREMRRERLFCSHVARAVIEQCLREIQALRVQAPDSEIVKERITSKLRRVANEINFNGDDA